MKINKKSVSVIRYAEAKSFETQNDVSIEEPLELFIDGNPYYLTMRLPGDEMALALGYLFTEGIIDSAKDISYINYCRNDSGNRVEISLDSQREGITVKEKKLPTYSSCGICGKELIGDINLNLHKREINFKMHVSGLGDLQDTFRKNQHQFPVTGGTQAAAIFNRECSLISFSEDVGRHNALDKAIGTLVGTGRISEAAITVLTSRLSYEMVQKTACTGVEILIGFSAATSLAIELAESVNITLIGFSREGCGTIYTVPERILF